MSLCDGNVMQIHVGLRLHYSVNDKYNVKYILQYYIGTRSHYQCKLNKYRIRITFLYKCNPCTGMWL